MQDKRPRVCRNDERVVWFYFGKHTVMKKNEWVYDMFAFIVLSLMSLLFFFMIFSLADTVNEEMIERLSAISSAPVCFIGEK